MLPSSYIWADSSGKQILIRFEFCSCCKPDETTQREDAPLPYTATICVFPTVTGYGAAIPCGYKIHGEDTERTGVRLSRLETKDVSVRRSNKRAYEKESTREYERSREMRWQL